MIFSYSSFFSHESIIRYSVQYLGHRLTPTKCFQFVFSFAEIFTKVFLFKSNFRYPFHKVVRSETGAAGSPKGRWSAKGTAGSQQGRMARNRCLRQRSPETLLMRVGHPLRPAGRSAKGSAGSAKWPVGPQQQGISMCMCNKTEFKISCYSPRRAPIVNR